MSSAPSASGSVPGQAGAAEHQVDLVAEHVGGDAAPQQLHHRPVAIAGIDAGAAELQHPAGKRRIGGDVVFVGRVEPAERARRRRAGSAGRCRRRPRRPARSRGPPPADGRPPCRTASRSRRAVRVARRRASRPSRRRRRGSAAPAPRRSRRAVTAMRTPRLPARSSPKPGPCGQGHGADRFLGRHRPAPVPGADPSDRRRPACAGARRLGRRPAARPGPPACGRTVPAGGRPGRNRAVPRSPASVARAPHPRIRSRLPVSTSIRW